MAEAVPQLSPPHCAGPPGPGAGRAPPPPQEPEAPPGLKDLDTPEAGLAKFTLTDIDAKISEATALHGPTR